MDESPSTQQSAPLAAHLEVDLTGRSLGDFRVRRSLGRGGMGQVYLAEQISLKREVALKTLRPDLAANQASLERFEAEAKAVAKATHANIVQIYVIDKAQVDNHMVHYLALEYVEGRNLREFLEKKGTPDLLVGLSIMHQVSSALQRASELGIIHRDIKPENILLTRKGEVKVADFGLSRCFSDPARSASMTQSGVTMGTPLYMAPEQVEQKPVDPRTDIYSFGVTCYHMFAGQPPFKGSSPFEIALQQVQKAPAPLAEIRPDLPGELCALVHKMMAKKPEDRPQTAREIVREVGRLRDVLVGVSSASSPSISGVERAEAIPTPAPSLSGTGNRGRWVLGIMGIFLAVVLGLGGSYLYSALSPGQQRGVVPPDDPGIKTGNPGERENELLRLVQENSRPESLLTRLKHTLELGCLYLQEGKLAEAESFFDKVGMQKEFGDVGKLGTAMVLALRAEPDASNKIFQEILPDKRAQDKREDLRNFWLNYPPWRKMMAWALYHNKANSPGSFPAELEPWLRAPRPATPRS